MTQVTHRLFALSLQVTGVLLLVLSALSCDEALPARDEPKKFLKAALRVQQLPVRVDIDSSGQLPYGVPPYPERVSGFGGSLELLLTSFYNEVLQDQAEVRGTIDVWLESRPDVRTTVTLTDADVDYPVFDPDGLLTLVPGDSVHLAKQWAHRGDNGKAFFRYVPLRTRVDATGRWYYESAPVRFNAQGTLQVFKNVQAEKTDVYEFELIYRIYVVLPP